MLPIIVALALLSIAPCQATDKNIENVAEKITDILRRNESIFDPLFTFDAQEFYGYHPAWKNFSHFKVDSVKDLKVRIKEVKKTGFITTAVSCEMYFYPDVRGIVNFQWEDDNEQIHKGVIDPMILFAKQDPMAFTVDFSVRETSPPKIVIKSVRQTSTCTWGYSYKCTDTNEKTATGWKTDFCYGIENTLMWGLKGSQDGQNFAAVVSQVLKDNV